MNKTINSPYPEIEYTDTHFYIVFKQSKEYITITKKERSGQKRWSELTERQKEIMYLISQNRDISRKQLSEILNINQSAIQKQITKLKQKDFLKRVGPPKGGHWEIVE